MAFILDYGLFLAKALTIVLSIVIVLLLIASIKKSKSNNANKIKLSSLNEHYADLKEQLVVETLDKKAFKSYVKAQKKKDKEAAKSATSKPKLFVLDFDGDIQASQVSSLREHISAIIQVAEDKDRVFLRLESGGGYVHSYGLAASQLQRLREKDIYLTVAVDKVAASGGYMMACVANELVAAPFAIIGSVGVIGAIPNFHDVLEKNDIHYEQHTAGKHKRSLTMLGKNTDEDRAQFQKELAETHVLFKDHIQAMRPELNVEAIATGETWYGKQALANHLIDKVQTSDDYLLSQLEDYQMMQLKEEVEETIVDKLKSKFLGKISGNKPFKSQII